jgi:hypothetical protein
VVVTHRGAFVSGKIYIVGTGGQLVTMEEEPYEAEALLQGLLAEHPDLLAGDQMRPSAPRRWLLISRELSVPDEVSEKSRWALDHLFIDQEGIPTLVEVKRSSNSQIRREVVGQMLDYAANGTLYWSPEQISAAFVRRCERDGLDPNDVLGTFLGEETEWDVSEFWQAVKTNLQAGRVRLVFVADRIPAELRRIIEFLNDQMDPAEVIGVEVPQFVGEGRQALVPRVVGLTAEAERRKSISATGGRNWDRDSFFEELAHQRSTEEVEAARRLFDWAEAGGLRVKWGSGSKNGSFGPKARVGDSIAHLFSVYTDYTIQISFGSMNLRPFDDREGRRELADRLEGVNPGLRFEDSKLDGWPFAGKPTLHRPAEIEAFLTVWDWYLERLRGV